MKRHTHGFSLLELLVVMAILGILASLGVMNLTNARSPARETALTVHSELFKLRAGAVANTQARRMVLTSTGTLQLQSALRCSDADQSHWTTYATVTLPKASARYPVTLSTPAVPVPTPNVVACFTPRGLAEAGGRLNVSDTRGNYTVTVALAGGVQTSGS